MYLEVGNVFASLTHSNFIILHSVTFIYSFVIMGEDLILFASGVQMYLSFTMELKTKPPNHNFSTCYLRKNLVFLNNYVMFTIPFVCSSFCSIFFFQSYIHGSSQAQFVAETHIVIVLSILLLFTD